MKKVTAAIIGYGGRGRIYASYALTNPSELEVVAIAEPKAFLRNQMAQAYRLNQNQVFHSYDELFDKGVLADAVFICTQDNMHIDPAIKAIEMGYKNILLEKPISPSLEECKQLANLANVHHVNIQVCHSLRYTAFYRKLKELIDSGIIGDIININHSEGVGHFHFAHSFVRGDWSNSGKSSPMILAKCCHDTDLLLYLTGRSCKSVSSYGSLIHFKEENAPEGSTLRCIENCSVKNTCAYNAVSGYIQYPDFAALAVEKEGHKDLTDAMQNGRYGMCVYRCDNNVVDHQVVNILFDNQTTATLTMCAFEEDRVTSIGGTKGSIHAVFGESVIRVKEFASNNETTFRIAHGLAGHGGADEMMIRDFVSMVRNSTPGVTDINVSVQSHAMCHAAERSRLEERNVSIAELMGGEE